jgi:hypothetical protein
VTDIFVFSIGPPISTFSLTTLRSCILLDSSFSVSPLLGCDW